MAKNLVRLLPPLILATSIGLLFLRLADYDACFQDPECFHNFSPCALKDGTAIGPRNLENCFDVWGLDGDCRPRPVSYFLSILTIKCRLALWKIVPMHPSFSPLWLVSLAAGPILFYKFLRLSFESTPLAQLGTALYLTSSSLLSAAVFLFHPAKPLANFSVILALYLSARAGAANASSAGLRRNAIPIPLALAWVMLMPILLLADETAAFSLVVPVVWCPALFLPNGWTWTQLRGCLFNGVVAALPLAFYTVFVLLAMPFICNALFGRTFDFGDYVGRLKGHFGPTALARHSVELLTATVLPWPIVGREVPIYSGPPWNPWGLAILYAVAAASVLWAVRRQGTYWSVCKPTALLTAGSILFMSYVASHHDLQLVLTGFYYGGITNVFLVVLLTCMAAALAQRANTPSWAAPALVVALMMVQVYNFSILLGIWRQHHNYKTLTWLRNELPYNPYFTNASLQKIARLPDRYKSAYAADVPHTVGGFQMMYPLWSDRQVRRAESVTPLALRDMWLACELYYLRGRAETPSPPPLLSPSTGEPARLLQEHLVLALDFALQRESRAADSLSSVPLPVVGLRQVDPADEQLAILNFGQAVTVLGYPAFQDQDDLKKGLSLLRKEKYNLLIVETRALKNAELVSPEWGFHHGFRRAWESGRLPELGLRLVGEVRLAGHDMTVFELGRK